MNTLIRVTGLTRYPIVAAILAFAFSPNATGLSGREAPHTPVPATAISAAAPPAAFSSYEEPAASSFLHLSVGRLLFLNTKQRVRRIYIANPDVLSSYVASPEQIVITAKTPGIGSVVIWDDAGQAQTYTVSADVDVDRLRAAIQNALPAASIAVEANEGRVVLSGTVGSVDEAETAAKLAGMFAHDVVNSIAVNPARTPQVKLRVRFVEIDRSRLTQLGFNLFNPGGGNYLASSTTGQFPSTATLTTGSGSSSGGTGASVGGNTLSISNPLNFLFYNSSKNIGLTIEDAENKQIAQILAEPTITTLSGVKASFLAGGEFPFPVIQGSSSGLTSITIQFRPYGVKLEFTPSINPDGTVLLRVIPEVSSLDYTNAVTISGYTIPAISTKHADTEVVLRNGQSFAISGLLDRRTTDELSRTPGIASIPILGQLFRSKSVNLSTTELMVIVTPTIVDPLTETEPPVEPDPARPFLNTKKFDKGLPNPATHP